MGEIVSGNLYPRVSIPLWRKRNKYIVMHASRKTCNPEKLTQGKKKHAAMDKDAKFRRNGR